MAVTEADVVKIASLARIHVGDEAQVRTLAEQMNGILAHMEVLSRVDTSNVTPTAGVGADGTPLRPDAVAPAPMRSTAEALTGESRDGLILVPRLSTHGDA